MCEGPPNQRIDMGMPREQYAVTAKQCDGIVRPEREIFVELLEIAELYGAQDETEKISIRGGEFAGNVDRPGFGAAVENGFADEPVEVLVRFERREIVAVGDVHFGNGPVAGEIDQLAIGVDQRDGVGLRQVADSLF